ncbi:MAG TPA: type II toxin-antitoxin system PemK/MazF family toxin [Phycicoccus sp.]|nr:type II toxin-antitoxin system PemK/MazF family toxin [Phycicoccus sp.]HQH07425.1 type II toxin-antitoxin system PemK/MazF family toxin [Phycicoccus sp.]HQK32584.1 type II toxin-antitoxin system PemK/MazF family toxin [Phycicoccus sp.]
MRPIHTARLDKVRPALVLTRSDVRDRRGLVTVAPITSRVRGLTAELPVGPRNGLDHEGVVKLDDILTIPIEDLGPQIGELLEQQEPDLAAAVYHAFELQW